MFQTVATGPVWKGNGTLVHRVVLRAFYRESPDNGTVFEYIVHNEVLGENGVVSYSDGNYFPVDCSSTLSVEVYKLALAKFVERMNKNYPHASEADIRALDKAIIMSRITKGLDKLYSSE